MVPLIFAGGLAALSIGSSILGNKSNGEALKTNVEQLHKDYTKQIGQLQEQFNSANVDIALEMTTTRYNGLKLTGSTSNTIAEKNIAGNTASKAYYQSSLSAMFAHNALEKKAEDTWKSFGVNMDNVKSNVNNAIYSATNKAQTAHISTLQAGTSAVQSSLVGYNMGSGLSSFMNSGKSVGGVAGATTSSFTDSAGFGSSSVSLDTGNVGIYNPLSSAYFG